MRKVALCIAFLFSMGMVQAQEESNDRVAVGDVLTLGNPSSSTYQYIDFPRRNIIIKRGAIADFKSLIGKKVVVEEINTYTDRSAEIILRRKDGRKFFRFFPTIKADLDNALTKGELVIPKV